MIRSLLILLVLAGGAIAQTTAPATLPTTRSDDASTPAGSLQLLMAALDAGDEAAIRDRLYTTSPIEEKIADATVRAATATPALYRAMVAAFGAAQTHTWLPDPQERIRARERNRQNNVEQISPDGQSAVVRVEGLAGVEPFEFRKVGDEWKWRVGKKLESTSVAEIEQQMLMIDLQVKVTNEVIGDIHAGKLKSVADVKQTMEAKARQANMEFIQAMQKRAATQPAK